MPAPVYNVNRGINKPIEFKGVKAQYIWHLAGSVIGVLIGFAIIYIVGVNSYICVALALSIGGLLIRRVFAISKKYGQYGLMKRAARKSVPPALFSRSRKPFIQLFSSHVRTTR
jgi:Domain of unknown function (DUF4133)